MIVFFGIFTFIAWGLQVKGYQITNPSIGSAMSLMRLPLSMILNYGFTLILFQNEKNQTQTISLNNMIGAIFVVLGCFIVTLNAQKSKKE